MRESVCYQGQGNKHPLIALFVGRSSFVDAAVLLLHKRPDFVALDTFTMQSAQVCIENLAASRTSRFEQRQNRLEVQSCQPRNGAKAHSFKHHGKSLCRSRRLGVVSSQLGDRFTESGFAGCAAPSNPSVPIGLDVHKKTISYCVKDVSGRICQEGKVGATRWELDIWIKTLPQPWTAAMESTIFTGWIYDHLKPHAAPVKVAHPLMLRAIAADKKKNDSIDAGKVADCLRCDFLPECYMAATEIRERRRMLRYRHLLKNRVFGLLMETGVSHNKQRLHKAGYFPELLAKPMR